MATTEPKPFGQDPEAQRRWKALIDWWEKSTGLSIGQTPADVGDWLRPVPISRLRGWCYLPGQEGPLSAWEGQSPELTRMLAQYDVLFPLLPIDDLAFWEQLGQAEINRRHKLIDTLKAAVAEVKAIRGGAGGWRLAFAGLQPGKLDELMAALEVVARFPNPYPAHPKPGDRIDQQVVQKRGDFLKALSKLTVQGGRGLSQDELTILYLLADPSGVGNKINEPVEWWKFQDSWAVKDVDDDDFDGVAVIEFCNGYDTFKRTIRARLEKPQS